MAELQQPDIVGNFLSRYNNARQQQMVEQDQAFQRERMQQQDGRADIVAKLQMMEGVVKTLGSAQDEAGLNSAKQQWVAMGLPAEAVAAYTAADIPMLREKAGTQFEALKGELLREQVNAQRANIRQSNAAAAASDRANRGGGMPPAGAGAPVVGGYSTIPVPDPYANMSTPAQRDALYRQEARSHAKTMEDAREAANVAAGARSQYGQFKSLAERNQTGGWYGAPVIGPVVRGIAGAVDSDLATMNALTARLAPNMRPPGSGASSNYDAQQFERATVGIDKPNAANVNISNAAIAQADRDIAYAQFADWYFRKARTQQGMDQAWLEYVNANPIFDPNDPNGYGLNEKRMDWQQWFGASQGGQGAAPAAPTPAKSGGWSVKKVQ